MAMLSPTRNGYPRTGQRPRSPGGELVLNSHGSVLAPGRPSAHRAFERSEYRIASWAPVACILHAGPSEFCAVF